MKISLMHFIIVSLFYTLNLCEVMIEKINSFIELGNWTDVGYINNLQNPNEISSTLIDTLKKYFYDHFQYGSINITNIYPMKGSQNIREKIEYFDAVSAFRMLSNPNEIISNDISKSGFDEKKDNVIFIAIGRTTDFSSSKFEYDIILKLNKNAIQVTSSDNTEFEIASLNFELSYRSALQNWIKDLIIENGILELKIKESIYPLVKLSTTINPETKDDYYTIIEVNMVQGIPNINSFIYYPLIIFYWIALYFFCFSVVDSFDRVRYNNFPTFTTFNFYVHWYFVVSILKLISGYLLEFYSFFKLVKLVSILANFGNVLMTIIIGFQVVSYNLPSIRYDLLVLVLFSIFHILIFYFLIFDLFWMYIVPNLWIYAIFTNVWMYKFWINFIWKVKISQYWQFWIPVSIIICFFQLDYFSVHSYENHFNIYYVLFLLIVHLVFIALVNMQQNKGSRFFIPNHMRTQKFMKLLQFVKHNNQEDQLIWQVWMNPLDQPELEYSDRNPAYKWMRFPIGTYIKTNWSHIFHPNWILKSTTLISECPVWMYFVDIYGFDD